MTPREELEALRRLAELEAKKGSVAPAASSPAASQDATPSAGPSGATPESVREDFRQRTQAVRGGELDELKRLALGLKQTIMGLTPEQKETVKEIERSKEEGPYAEERRKGAMSATGLTTVAPGMGVGTTLMKTLASVAPRAAPYLAPLVAGATSGVQEAVTTPSTAETPEEVIKEKAVAGGKAAAVGTVLSGTLSALGKTATGLFKPTKEAAQLMEEGMTPTLQQGAEGRIGKFVGGLTSGIADVGERQGKEVAQAVVRRIAPGEAIEDYTKREIVEAGKNSLERDYADVLRGKQFRLTKADKAAMNLSLDPKGLDEEAKKIVTRELNDVLPERSITNMGHGRMQEIRDKLQERVDNLMKDDSVSGKKAREFLEKAKDSFDNVVRNPKLTPDEITAVGDIDKRAYDFARLKHAAANKTGNEVTGQDILRSYKQTEPTDEFLTGTKSAVKSEILEPAERIMGGSTTQEQSRAGLQAMRRAAKILGAGAANVFSGGAVAPLYALSAAGQSAPGARVLFGQTAKQKMLADLLRQTRGAEAGLGAALYNPEGEE